MNDEDLWHSTHRENDKDVLDRKRKNEDMVDPLPAEADRRNPSLAEGSYFAPKLLPIFTNTLCNDWSIEEQKSCSR